LDLTIRLVEKADIPSILEVYRQCEDFLALGPVSIASREMVEKDLQESLSINGQYHGIFDSDLGMIGVVDYVPRGFEHNPETAFIELLMIASPHRSKGLGTEILQQVEQRVRQNSGVTRIEAGVQSNNPNALRFWERNGFETVSGPSLQPDGTTTYHLRKAL
jgi:RimJ/RimL family protein N-acetyltransferase